MDERTMVTKRNVAAVTVDTGRQESELLRRIRTIESETEKVMALLANEARARIEGRRFDQAATICHYAAKIQRIPQMPRLLGDTL